MFLLDLPEGDGGVAISRGAIALYSALARLALEPVEVTTGRYGIVMANLELRNKARYRRPAQEPDDDKR